jgi:hypothetical protein
VHVANHESRYLGFFDQFQCQWATVYIQATLNESNPDGTFDLQACMSDSPDPYDPSVCSSLGTSLVMGYPAGTWKTFYPFTPQAPPLFVSPGGPARQYVHFRVFSNQAGRYVVEVHCRPTYPSELPTPTPTPLGAVGGIAELPPLASAPGGSGVGGTTYAVLAGAAAGVLAFAVLATLTVKRRGVR